jgi:hypothetical protein
MSNIGGSYRRVASPASATAIYYEFILVYREARWDQV